MDDTRLAYIVLPWLVAVALVLPGSENPATASSAALIGRRRACWH